MVDLKKLRARKPAGDVDPSRVPLLSAIVVSDDDDDDDDDSDERAPTEFSRWQLLPMELKLMIMSSMDIRSVTNLRRTSQFFYHYYTAERIRKQFTVDGQILPQLLECCASCLSVPGYDLVLDDERWQEPWRSMCFPCWRVKRSPLYFGTPTEIAFVGGRDGHVCTFCGWPVCSGRMHRPCSRIARCLDYGLFFSYFVALFMILIIARIRIHINRGASTLDILILLCALQFWALDLFLSLLELGLRGPPMDTCFFLDLPSIPLWIVPAISPAYDLLFSAPPHPHAALLCALAISRSLSHVANIVGHLIVASEYDTRTFSLPTLSYKRKILHILYSYLVYRVQLREHSRIGFVFLWLPCIALAGALSEALSKCL